jgi:hypothetical protein
MIFGIYGLRNAQRRYYADMQMNEIRMQQQRQREYLNSLPRYNGKSIVPIVPMKNTAIAAKN